MSLAAAQAGYLAMRAQLVRVMSNTDGTEQPDVLLAAYDAAVIKLHEAEVLEVAVRGEIQRVR